MTCLCLTRNRREWLPKAIQCFLNQTYRNRELLILADGADVRDLIPPDDSRIRLLCLDGATGIGEKRNFGCSKALGEIVAHWDDDDFSAPGRLDDQVARLVETRKAVTGYRSMRFTDGTRWWKFTYQNHNALGTSLCYRREWWQKHKFNPIQIGEDSAFVAAAAAEGQIALAEAGELMYATNHPGNTSPRMLGDNWKPL